jgi:hypothetical protein
MTAASTARGHALAACVRSASFHTPLIRSCTTKAANGPQKGARHQLSEAIRHARTLLFDLEQQQSELGWRDREERTA